VIVARMISCRFSSRAVLAPKLLRRMLQISEGITANIFHMINNLAVEAIESGREQITNEAVENLGAGVRHGNGVCMTEGLEPRRQLPIILLPVSDELLYSWITRHATFYGVPPLIMLRHCLPEASSLRAADFRLTDVQIRHPRKCLPWNRML
jgi:hypothetical protein